MLHESIVVEHAQSQTGTTLARKPESCRSNRDNVASYALATRITRAASKQAYYTIRLLADHDLRGAAYQAYAYFRWVDDRLDDALSERSERLAFLARQQEIVDSACRGQYWSDLTCEEQLITDLILSDDQPDSGLHSYIINMMAVMAFDAHRRGQWITQRELDQYTEYLSIAVTDALHYFIGHSTSASAHNEWRYFPAMAAHITHMLRDTIEDTALGYFDVPCELLESRGIDPHDVQSDTYREWVKGRVQLARFYFTRGACYIDQIPSIRCRLASYAYMARFVGLLDALEREEYRIRPMYPEFTHVGYALRKGGSVLCNALMRGGR